MGDEEKAVRLAANVIVRVVLDMIQADPHQWSARPCQTCMAVGAMTGADFGCYVYAAKRAPK